MNKKKQKGLLLRFDRVLAHKILKQLAILAALLIAAFILSYIFLSFSGAEWEAFCNHKELSQWLLPLYLLLDSNALNNLYFGDKGHTVHGWMLFASSISFLLGAFIFNGMIISVLTATISRRVEEHKEGLIHYLKSGHYIIMGFDDMVVSVISNIFEKDKDAYILVLSEMEAVTVREILRRTFDEKIMKRIIVNYGHRTSVECYKDIHLEAAEHVYIIGYREASDHDAINVECVDSICNYLNQPGMTARPQRIICVFEDLDTYAAFITTDIFDKVKQLKIEFIPYNFYTGWAKQVFSKCYHRERWPNGKRINYPSVFIDCVSEIESKKVHLVFVGTTYFAVAFAMEAAHIIHLPFFEKDLDKRRMRITFIDINADKEKDLFITRYRHYFELQPYFYQDLSCPEADYMAESREMTEYLKFKQNECGFLDVEFEFIKGDIFSKAVQDKICLWANDKSEQELSIFLAMNNQRRNFAIGMNMPDEVYVNEIPVFIRQDRSDNFVTNLRLADSWKKPYTRMLGGRLAEEQRSGRYANIYPFGMTDTGYSSDNTSLQCAKIMNYLYATADYENYKFLSLDVLNSMSHEELKKIADEKWHALNVALQWSSLYNAYTLRVKVACLRKMRGLLADDDSQDLRPLTEQEVEILGRAEHNRWNMERLLMGFRKAREDEDKFNEVRKGHEENAKKLMRNKNLFIHHAIRPYDDLDNTKELDREFSRYIPWIIKASALPNTDGLA